MKSNVTGHYIAVIPDEIEKKSSGGIVLAEEYDPDKAARVEAASTKGKVIYVGSMAWRAYDGNDPDWKPWAKVGDTIWFQKHVAKVIEDKENIGSDGKPQKIFIMADENIIWRED